MKLLNQGGLGNWKDTSGSAPVTSTPAASLSTTFLGRLTRTLLKSGGQHNPHKLDELVFFELIVTFWSICAICDQLCAHECKSKLSSVAQ